MKKMRKLAFIALCLLLIFSGCGDKTTAENTALQDPGSDYEYTNQLNQTAQYHCENSNAAIYEKTVDNLIQEWTDNVALAENTYNKPDVIIFTEGFIQSINKDGENYYIVLSSGKHGNIFSTDELRVFFTSDETIQELWNVKTGDYVSLACTAQDTSYFLEYPELRAEKILCSTAADEASGLTASQYDISDYVGLTVSDIIDIYGEDYETGCVEGGMAMFYENCGYEFFYKSAPDISSLPDLDDEIFTVDAYKEGTHVFGNVTIGMSLEEFESAVGETFDDQIAEQGDGQYVEVSYDDGTYLYFVDMYDFDRKIDGVTCRRLDLNLEEYR